MKVLIGCEYSGEVRDAFIAAGNDAISCDLLPSDKTGPHIQGDIFVAIDKVVPDLGIFFPPCTDLCVSGARWWPEKIKDGRQWAAIQFVRALANAPIKKICIENPIGILSTAWRKPDQIIQPWQHGHGETKATCLWLKGLPLIKPTCIVGGREARIHKLPPSPTRWKERSKTFSGIAIAMANQWG
jgi:site-specific DNA-cytosine methylase